MQNFGTLSTLGKIQTLLRTTDLNTARLSTLASLYKIEGASEASLSRALKSGKSLGHGTEEGLAILVFKLERLIASSAPVEIYFGDPEKIKQWLDDLEQGKLCFLVISSEDGDPSQQQQMENHDERSK